MPDAKLERLLNLTAALLDTPRPLTAEQLQRRVAGYPEDIVAFRRQFERDKETLREMGVPLRLDDVEANGQMVTGYRIHPDEYYLPEIDLTPDELAALHLALRAVHLDGARGAESLWKLGGVVAGADQPDGAPLPQVTLPADSNLSTLFAACRQRQVVEITTGGTTREVEPHSLRFSRGRWYLMGHDRLRDERRSYRVDRITDEVRLIGRPEAFEPTDTEGPDLEPWRISSEPPVSAVLLLDPVVAPSALLELTGAVVRERRADGSIVVEVEVTNADGFRSYVLGLLDHAEVLEPPALRDAMVAWLESCAATGNP